MSEQATGLAGVKPDMGFADQILRETGEVTESDLIPLLQKLQDAYGYLPPSVLKEVSERTGIPTSRMYGVITFYAQFHLAPRGRHLIRCCRGTACHVRGGKSIIQALERELGIKEGGTTPDRRFTFETVACLGACALAPVVVVDGVYHGKATIRGVAGLLNRLKGDDESKTEVKE